MEGPALLRTPEPRRRALKSRCTLPGFDTSAPQPDLQQPPSADSRSHSDHRRSSQAELIRGQGSSKSLDDVEDATPEWVEESNHRRLLEPIGYVPPVEAEGEYYGGAALQEEEGLKQMGLHRIRGGSRGVFFVG